jgi:hypothetical protein
LKKERASKKEIKNDRATQKKQAVKNKRNDELKPFLKITSNQSVQPRWTVKHGCMKTTFENYKTDKNIQNIRKFNFNCNYFTANVQ